MSYMVTFQGTDGSLANHQSENLEDASLFVEQLSNEQGVQGARIFRMEEIFFELKPYYKVEVQGASTGNGQSAPAPRGSQPARVEATAPAAPPAPTAVTTATPAPKVATPAVESPDVTVAEVPSIELPADEPTFEAPAAVADAADAAPVNAQRRGLFGR